MEPIPAPAAASRLLRRVLTRGQFNWAKAQSCSLAPAWRTAGADRRSFAQSSNASLASGLTLPYTVDRTQVHAQNLAAAALVISKTSDNAGGGAHRREHRSRHVAGGSRAPCQPAFRKRADNSRG